MLWILFPAGVLIAYCATAISIKISLRQGVLDLPNARSSHTGPVPRMGGLGMLTAFYLITATFGVLGKLGLVQFAPYSQNIIVILFAAAVTAAAGLIDDLYHLKQAPKFLMQFVIALMLVAYGIRLEIISIPAWRVLGLGVFSFPLTILWLTGFSNVYNFMDGINGLAAGTAAVYGAFFFIIAWLQGDRELAAISVLLSGSCLGFLFHNFPVARTFMGDSGSLFLGMIFALIVVRLAQHSRNPSSLVALLLICSVYLYDSTFTLFRRLRHGENIFLAHRSHLYQRLVLAGHSHVKITGLYLFMHVLMGSLAVFYFLSSEPMRWWILIITSVIFLVFTHAVHQIENRAGNLKAGTTNTTVRSSNQEKPHN